MNIQPLKDARKRQKIKLGELAEVLSVSRVTMGNYEGGRSVPTLEFTKRWAEHLGLQIGFIQEI